MPKTKTKKTAPAVEEVPEITEEVVEEAAPPATTMTPKEFAELVGSDPKTVRRFLRSTTQQKAGKGGRWGIDLSLVDELKTRFEARSEPKAVVDSVDEADDSDVEELEDIDEL